jgi:hypothetical protein
MLLTIRNVGNTIDDVAYWHLSDMPTGPDDVRFQGKTGSRR